MASVILCSYWLLYVVFCVIYGTVYAFNIPLSQFLKDILLFGKTQDKKRKWTIVQLLEIPKSWFTHFYIVGSILNGYMAYICVMSYVIGVRPPAWLIYSLETVSSKPWITSTDAGSAILLIMFMCVQNCRRLYECLFVSVYSKGRINVLHYIMGHSLYTLFHLSVLCEAPNILISRLNDPHNELLQMRNIAAGGLFFWASWQQHEINKSFAALRTNKQGKVETLEHKIPCGGWFDLVSCPHYFMEVVIYLSFIIVSGGTHVTMWCLFLFVLANQLMSAFMSHKWYKETYKTYPKKRKAIFPYLI